MFEQSTNQAKNKREAPPAIAVSLGIDVRTAARLEPRGLERFTPPTVLIQNIDPETGEIISTFSTPKGEKQYKTPQQARAERFALKSVVNQIFPNSNYSKCCRCRRDLGGVTIQKSKKHGKAHYGGLVTCSSVWACPVCAAKIAERRRSELVAATSAAQMMGLQVALATFTVPHGLGDDINVILDRMMSSWRFMGKSKGYRQAKKFLGLVGTVRALETTHGQNGFHPHFHVLLFCNTDNTSFAECAQFLLLPLWQHACVKSGLPEPSFQRGVKVDNGSRAAQYVSKWGLEDEITKGHFKTSKGINGRSPWDLLRSVLVDDCDKSRRLFAVYAQAFKGRRQLYWSNGLRDLLGLVKEATDSEIAENQEDDAFELASISIEEWRGVLFTRSEAALLDLAERVPVKIPEFLAALVAVSQHAVSPDTRAAKVRTPADG